MSFQTFAEVKQDENLQMSNHVKLVANGGEEIQTAISIVLPFHLNGQIHMVQRDVQSLLGLSDCLLSIHSERNFFAQQINTEYADLFQDEAQPVIYPACRIPVAMQHKIKAELERMVFIGVLTPVSEPTD